MNCSLADPYLGYRLSQKKILLSVFTTSSLHLGMPYGLLAKEQARKWFGHTVLSVVHYLYEERINTASLVHTLTCKFFQMHFNMNCASTIDSYLIPHFQYATNTVKPIAPTPMLLNNFDPEELKISQPPLTPPNEQLTAKETADRTAVSDSFLDPYTLPALNKKIIYTDSAELLSAAEVFFNTYPIPAPLTFPNINTTDLTFSNLFSTLLSQYDGICIGELHNHSSPKYLLVTNMPHFAQLGVDTLYLEGYHGMQDELDEYFLGNSLEIPESLKNVIGGFCSTQDPHYTEIDVLIAAKTVGIKMLSLDSFASSHVSSFDKSGILGVRRLAAFNYQANLIIAQNQATGRGKCIVYAGLAHTSSVSGVPGLGRICQFPAIAVYDSTTSFKVTGVGTVPPYVIQKNMQIREDRRDYCHDFLVSMDTPVK